MLTLASALIGLLLGGCGLANPTPRVEQVDNPAVREASRQAAAEVIALLDSALDGRSGHLRVRADVCEQGQNNWKVKQGFLWRCTVGAAAVVEAGEVEEGLRRQQSIMERLGCRSYHNETQQQVEDAEWLITRYWRQFHPGDPDYRADSLPWLTYLCPGGRTVTVQPTNTRDRDGHLADPLKVFAAPGAPGVFLDEQPPAAAVDALRGATRSPLLLVVGVEEQYHEVGA